MGEEKRIEILSNHIPKRYVDIYLYLLYGDIIYLPKDLTKCKEGKLSSDNNKLIEAVEELCLLLAKPIFKMANFYNTMPKKYIDIYLYIYNKEKDFLPDDLKRPDSKRFIKKVELRKETKNLALLMAKKILELSEVV